MLEVQGPEQAPHLKPQAVTRAQAALHPHQLALLAPPAQALLAPPAQALNPHQLPPVLLAPPAPALSPPAQALLVPHRRLLQLQIQRHIFHGVIIFRAIVLALTSQQAPIQTRSICL